MILLIDNYDSFVYNLARYFTELGCETKVVRNDAASIEQIRSWTPRAIVLSPGPCTPKEAGICIETVREFYTTTPILGVCLGHQAIAAAFDADVVRAVEPVHGRTSGVQHDGSSLFTGLPNPLQATRYHSLVVSENSLNEEFDVPARTSDGIVMAVSHRRHPLFGVQFHPESVMTDGGHRLLANFLSICGIPHHSNTHSDEQLGELVSRDAEESGWNYFDDSAADYPLHW